MKTKPEFISQCYTVVTNIIAMEALIISTYFLWIKKKLKQLFKRKPLQWKAVPFIDEYVTVEDPPLMGKIGKKVLNVGATSFLCLHDEDSIVERSIKTLNKYGLGSCGPRVFFGTTDVHLELERRLSRFLGAEETCMYSYGFVTVASAIPSYGGIFYPKKRRGAIFFVDENVHFAIQKGLDAAHGSVHFFKHNDVVHLEQLVSEAAKKKELNAERRAFIIAEAIYYNTGEICPLKQIVELAKQYKIRIILDESLTVGVLGKHGRGLAEHLDIPREEIDMTIGSLEHTFATIGGFTSGSHFMIDLQRMAGSGYCYSASLPPMLTQGAISALDILERKPNIVLELNEICRKMNEALSKIKHYKFRGDELSPIKHIYIKKDLPDRLKDLYLRHIAKYCLERGVAFAVAQYLRDIEHNCPEPSIRLACHRKLNDDNIALICLLLDEAYEKVGPTM